MKTVSLKMPDAMDSQLAELARRTGRSKSLLVRLAVSKLLPRRFRSSGSFFARAADLAGSVQAGPDLSTNKRRLARYGR